MCYIVTKGQNKYVLKCLTCLRRLNSKGDYNSSCRFLVINAYHIKFTARPRRRINYQHSYQHLCNLQIVYSTLHLKETTSFSHRLQGIEQLYSRELQIIRLPNDETSTTSLPEGLTNDNMGQTGGPTI